MSKKNLHSFQPFFEPRRTRRNHFASFVFFVAKEGLLFFSKTPQNKASIIPARHSRVVLAGIQKKSPDARPSLRWCRPFAHMPGGCWAPIDLGVLSLRFDLSPVDPVAELPGQIALPTHRSPSIMPRELWNCCSRFYLGSLTDTRQERSYARLPHDRDKHQKS